MLLFLKVYILFYGGIMQKRYLITNVLVMFASALLVVGCQKPIETPVPGELDAIKDVSYSGSTIASKDDALTTLATIVKVFNNSANPNSSQPGFSFDALSPTVNSRSLNGLPIEGLDEFLASGYKGTVRFSMDVPPTQLPDGSGMALNLYADFTLRHNIPMTEDFVLDFNCDQNPDGKLPQTIFEYMNTQDPQYPYAILNNNTITASGSTRNLITLENIQGSGEVNNQPVELTLNKALMNVKANFSLAVSNLSVQLNKEGDNDPMPEITSGSMNLASAADSSFLLVVSSSNDAVKGGKLLITFTNSKTESNVDLLQLYNMFKNMQDPEELNNMIIATFGNPEEILVTIKVFDNTNTKILDATCTFAEFLSKVQG